MDEDLKYLLLSLASVCAIWLDGITLDEWDDPFYDELEDILEKIQLYVGDP